MSGMRRSRLVALGLSAGALAGLVGAMVATAKAQPPAPQPPVSTTEAPGAKTSPAAEPPANPFAGRRSITQTGAS